MCATLCQYYGDYISISEPSSEKNIESNLMVVGQVLPILSYRLNMLALKLDQGSSFYMRWQVLEDNMDTAVLKL